jgi:hypothetical protein
MSDMMNMRCLQRKRPAWCGRDSGPKEYNGAEEDVGANDRSGRERKQTNFLADAMKYPASTKSYDAGTVTRMTRVYEGQ